MAGNERQKTGRQFEVPLSGKRYIGRTDSHIDWHVYFFGEYDPLGTRFLRHISEQIDDCVFLDIGANTGTHTLAISDHCESIHCFEPYPAALTSLKRHLEMNEIENAFVHPFGLSVSDGLRGFCENKTGNLGAGTFELNNETADMQLPTKRGDDVFEQLELTKSDVVKVDVEGHEFDVLRGMSKHLWGSRPIVLWEFNPQAIGVQKKSEIEALFPDEYVFFRLGFKDRWSRSRPKLQTISSLERGNLVSAPKTKLSLIENLIEDLAQ